MNGRRRAAWLLAASLSPFVLLPAPARAAAGDPSAIPPHAPPAMRRVWAARQSGLCLIAIREAERRYRLPPGRLGAISRVETGRPLPVTGDRQPWPWTVNAAGIGHWYDSRAAAAAAASRLLAETGGNVDVGCMQVNLRYHAQAFRSFAEALDPATNVDVGARLLRTLSAGRSWEQATALYHSATPALGTPYRDGVLRMQAVQRATLADAAVQTRGGAGRRPSRMP